MSGTAKQQISAYLNRSDVSKSYLKVINYLLQKYASNELILQTEDRISNMIQKQAQNPSVWIDYVTQLTSKCGFVYGKKASIEVFNHVLDSGMSEHIRSNYASSPGI